MNTFKKVKTVGLAMIAFLLTTTSLMAQRTDSTHKIMRDHARIQLDRQRDRMGIPNLTEDQKTKIKAQRVAFGKEALPLTSQLAEKRAHLRTLQTAQAYDASAVNAAIDDITKTQSQLMKKKAANREAIRKLLNDEQRLAFDSRNGHKRGFGRFHDRHKQGHRN
jgi:Spy/CpxP family protein refolding chaperone